MHTSPELSTLQAVQELVKVYREPEVERNQFNVLTQLFIVLTAVQERREGTAISRLEESEHVRGLLSDLKPFFEAEFGLLIGGLITSEERRIDEEIAQHQNRIELMHQTDDLAAAYDRLKATGWKTDLTIEQWTSDDDYERMIAEGTETFCIGRLEYDKVKITRLFDEFVCKGGSLSPSEQKVSERTTI